MAVIKLASDLFFVLPLDPLINGSITPSLVLRLKGSQVFDEYDDSLSKHLQVSSLSSLIKQLSLSVVLTFQRDSKSMTLEFKGDLAVRGSDVLRLK